MAEPVGEVTDGVRQLLDDMAETMYDAPGIGLAAPQINISERLIVMDCGPDDAPELHKMINPEMLAAQTSCQFWKKDVCRSQTRRQRSNAHHR